MTTKERIIRAIRQPSYIGSMLLTLFSRWIKDDEWYIKTRYRLYVGKKLRLDAPETFNEKLQWLKLYDRKPIYTTMVDKCEAKKYVADIIGEEHIIPTIAVYDRVEDIDFDALPDQFVMKCTHDCGGLVICKDKGKLDKKTAVGKLRKCLNSKYYLRTREWPYMNVKPRIIAEQYMEDESGYELKDYKFFCFNGVVKCLKVDYNRYIDHHANYYDRDMNLLPFGEVVCTPDFNHVIEKPKNLEKMIELAEKLSKGMPFLRVDFYNISGKIYFGELTFFPASGMGKFTSEEWDYTLGSWIKLPKGEYKIN